MEKRKPWSIGLFIMLIISQSCVRHDVPPDGFVLRDLGDSIILFSQDPSLVIKYDTVYNLDGADRVIRSACIISDTDTLHFTKNNKGDWILNEMNIGKYRGKTSEIIIESDNKEYIGLIHLKVPVNIIASTDTIGDGDTIWLNERVSDDMKVKIFVRARNDSMGIYATCDSIIADGSEYFILKDEDFRWIDSQGEEKQGLPHGIYDLQIVVISVYENQIEGIEGLVYGRFTNVSSGITLLLQ